MLRKISYVIGILASLAAAEGLYRLYNLISFLGSSDDAMFYLGLVVISLLATIAFALAFAGKLNKIFKWMEIVLLVISAMLMLFTPPFPVVIQIIVGLIIVIICLVFAKTSKKTKTTMSKIQPPQPVEPVAATLSEASESVDSFTATVEEVSATIHQQTQEVSVPFQQEKVNTELPKHTGQKKHVLTIVVSILVGVVFTSLVGAGVFYYFNDKKTVTRDIDIMDDEIEALLLQSQTPFNNWTDEITSLAKDDATTIKERKHPIDKWYEEQDAITTVDIKEALALAEEKWDEELNIQYKKLMDRLTPANKKILRDSQRKWIAYRDAEFKFLDELYMQWHEDSGGGTIWGVICLNFKMEFVRGRTLTFIEYLDNFID